MRFNSPEHLATWQRTKRYPAIHDNMAAAANSYVRGARLLDLGCSYGLLGARIAKEAGSHRPVGVDADKSVIDAANQAGVPMEFYHLEVNAETLSRLETIIMCHGIDVIIARRILPELFGLDPVLGCNFAAMCAAAGVKEMLVEGRVVSARSTNALASIDDEVDMLSMSYREIRRVKAVSYLRAV